jgi:transcriptional regulator with XRE-family HTH domain
MVYDNIKSIAEKKGMSIAEIEKKAGIGNGTIGRWSESYPNVDSIVKVAKVLSVSINTLVKE